MDLEYAIQDFSFWRDKYEKIKAKMNEVQESRKTQRTENIAL